MLMEKYIIHTLEDLGGDQGKGKVTQSFERMREN